MAVNNWFQTWHPPHFQQPFDDPFKNYTVNPEYQAVKKATNPIQLLPLYFSLNFLQPAEKKSEKNSHTFFPPFSPKKETNIPSNDHHFFKIPTEHPRTGNRGNQYHPENNFGLKTQQLRIPNKKQKFTNKHPHSHYGLPIEYRENTKGKPEAHSYNEHLGFPDPFREHASPGKKYRNRTYEEEHNLRPLELTGPFKTWYRWKTLDFKYPSGLEKSRAIASEEFVAENNLPLGIEVYKDRIFLSMPKWKPGVPVTLAWLPRVPKEESPELIPYPNWGWHSEKSCDLITSVFRMYADHCGRLWVLDSGKISITTEEAKQHCPPKLLIFDLETDELLEKFIFPDKFIKEDSLYSNIVVDIREEGCHDAYAYMVDVWRFGLVVFRLIDHKAWRISDHLFFPDPLAARYQLHNLKFEWTDGIFGLTLSPLTNFDEDRILYFHPMSSFREFYVKTSYLRDEHSEDSKSDVFKVLGQSRGPSGHVSSSVMDENGIMYYNLVTRDSIGCWDSRKPYKRENLGLIAKSSDTLVFPNDMRLDKEERQSMWIVTNRLPYYLLEGLDVNKINFRVMSAYTDDSIKGSICDPNVHNQYTYIEYKDEYECY